jgi:hypothetical protein
VPHTGVSGNKEMTAAPHTGDCSFILRHTAQDPVVDPYTLYIASPNDGTLHGLKHVVSEFYR